MNWSNLPLIWRDGRKPPEDIEVIVRAEIASDLQDLGTPSDLVFHTVFLDGDNCVIISGFEDREDAFDAGYYTE